MSSTQLMNIAVLFRFLITLQILIFPNFSYCQTSLGRSVDDNHPLVAEKALNTTGFPKSFMWGVTSAALSIEGGTEDRQRVIWDTFDGTLNKEKPTGVDHYSKWFDDLYLIEEMQLDSYKLSFSWARIMEDDSTPNKKGIDFYSDIIDRLIERKITPVVVLYYWDLPLKFQQDFGGWGDDSQKIDAAFLNYAQTCFNAFGDRVKMWITFDEPQTFIVLGYGTGEHAPGVSLNITDGEPLEIIPRVLKIHADVYNAYSIYKNDNNFDDGQIGLSLRVDWAEPRTVDTTSDDYHDDLDAASRQRRANMERFLDPILEGQSPGLLEPYMSQHEIDHVKGSCDFVVLNLYTSRFVSNSHNQGCAGQSSEVSTCTVLHLYDSENKPIGVVPDINNLKTCGPNKDTSCQYLNQMAVYPEGLKKQLEHYREHYSSWGLLDTYVSFGYPDGDLHVGEGRMDVHRADFMHEYLEAMRMAMVEEHVPVKGFFMRSLLDGFEWNHGPSVRFGLYYVRSDTLVREPKLSSLFYADYIKSARWDSEVEWKGKDLPSYYPDDNEGPGNGNGNNGDGNDGGGNGNGEELGEGEEEVEDQSNNQSANRSSLTVGLILFIIALLIIATCMIYSRYTSSRNTTLSRYEGMDLGVVSASSGAASYRPQNTAFVEGVV